MCHDSDIKQTSDDRANITFAALVVCGVGVGVGVTALPELPVNVTVTGGMPTFAKLELV